ERKYRSPRAKYRRPSLFLARHGTPRGARRFPQEQAHCRIYRPRRAKNRWIACFPSAVSTPARLTCPEISVNARLARRWISRWGEEKYRWPSLFLNTGRFRTVDEGGPPHTRLLHSVQEQPLGTDRLRSGNPKPEICCKSRKFAICSQRSFPAHFDCTVAGG